MIWTFSKFKLLLVVITCIFLLLSLSCIYASDDMDDAICHNQIGVDNDLNDAQDILSEIDSDADVSANIGDELSDDFHTLHAHDYMNPVEHSDEVRAGHHMNLAAHRDDVRVWHHRKAINSTLGKVTCNKPNFEERSSSNQSIGFYHTFGKNDVDYEFSTDLCEIEGFTSIQTPKKAIIDDGKGIWIAITIFNKQNSKNFTNSLSNLVKLDSDLVKAKFCCLKEGECNHNLKSGMQDNQKIMKAFNIIDASVIDANADDSSYSYNPNTQINTFKVVKVSFVPSKEEEDMNSENCILKNILSLNQVLDQINVESSFKNFSSDLEMDMYDFLVNFSDCDFDFNGLEINLISAKLYVKDYNLEYYIFSNPYIIVDNANFKNAPINNIIQNHGFNPKQTITPNINQNNSILKIETIFNQEFFIKNCLSNAYEDFLIENSINGDNYGKSSVFGCFLVKNVMFSKKNCFFNWSGYFKKCKF